MANLMLSVMGGFAEFERSLIRERQREGIALAQQRGAHTGRKNTLSRNGPLTQRDRSTSKVHPADVVDASGTGRPLGGRGRRRRESQFFISGSGSVR